MRTALEPKVTRTSAANGTELLIEAMGATDEWFLEMIITALIGVARFELQESTDNFSTIRRVAVFEVKGGGLTVPYTPPGLPNHRTHTLDFIGDAAGGELRLALVSITGSSQTVTYAADLVRNVAA